MLVVHFECKSNTISTMSWDHNWHHELGSLVEIHWILVGSLRVVLVRTVSVPVSLAARALQIGAQGRLTRWGRMSSKAKEVDRSRLTNRIGKMRTQFWYDEDEKVSEMRSEVVVEGLA